MTGFSCRALSGFQCLLASAEILLDCNMLYRDYHSTMFGKTVNVSNCKLSPCMKYFQRRQTNSDSLSEEVYCHFKKKVRLIYLVLVCFTRAWILRQCCSATEQFPCGNAKFHPLSARRKNCRNTGYACRRIGENRTHSAAHG